MLENVRKYQKMLENTRKCKRMLKINSGHLEIVSADLTQP